MDQLCSKCRRLGLPFIGPLLQFHAYAERLQISNFKASDGWLNRFKERHNISLMPIQGESNDVNPKRLKNRKQNQFIF